MAETATAQSSEEGAGLGRELGRFEVAQVLTDLHTPFNVVSVLRFRDSLDPGGLRRALDDLQARHALLRVALATETGPFRFRGGDVPAISLAVQETGSWRPAVEEELASRIDAARGPLMRCRLLSGDEGSDLLLSLHHVIVDQSSGNALVAELLALLRGEPLPKPSRSLPPATDASYPKPFRGGRLAWRCALFLLRQMADEARFRLASIGGRRPAPSRGGRCLVMTRSLEVATTRALVRQCRRRRVTLAALLDAVQLERVVAELYPGCDQRLRTFVFPDLRPYLPGIGGELASHFVMLRLTLPYREGSDPWDVAAEIARRTRKALRRGERWTTHRLSRQMVGWMLRSGKERMGTSALSYAGPVQLDDRGELASLHTFVSNLELGPELAAHARLFDGRLIWDALRRDSELDAAAAERIADGMVARLRELASPGSPA